jgi:hypothetical protein
MIGAGVLTILVIVQWTVRGLADSSGNSHAETAGAATASQVNMLIADKRQIVLAFMMLHDPYKISGLDWQTEQPHKRRLFSDRQRTGNYFFEVSV